MLCAVALMWALYGTGTTSERTAPAGDDNKDTVQESSTAHLTAGACLTISSCLKNGVSVATRETFVVGMAEERAAAPERSIPGYLKTVSPSESTQIILKKAETEITERRKRERKEAEETAFIQNAPDNVPNDINGCRSYRFSYERLTAITAKNSHQYGFCYSKCAADKDGFLRDKDGRYAVAVGTAYADAVGDKIDVQYQDGTIVKMVVGDFKSDRHTDPTHCFHLGWWGSADGKDVRSQAECEIVAAENPSLGYGWHQGDGSVIEFIVDPSIFTGTRPAFVRDDNPALKVVKIP